MREIPHVMLELLLAASLGLLNQHTEVGPENTRVSNSQARSAQLWTLKLPASRAGSAVAGRAPGTGEEQVPLSVWGWAS